MVAGALADLLYKRVQNQGINAASFIFIQASVFTTVIWIAVFLIGDSAGIVPATWQYGLLNGVINYVGLFLFVSSLKDGEASVNVPIFRLNFVVTALGAVVFLGEAASPYKGLGLVLAMGSVLSLVDMGAIRRGTVRGRSYLSLLIGLAAFGVTGVLAKKAMLEGSGAITLVAFQSITFAFCAFLNARFVMGISLERRVITWAPVMGGIQLSWAVMLFEAMRRGEASISYPIVQLSFVLTAILAVFTLREVLTKGKAIGLVLASLAVLAFTYTAG